MLVLSRKPGESIVIGESVTVDIVSIDGDRVCLGISAPKHVRVFRKELLQQTIDINRSAMQAPVLSFEGLMKE